MKRYVLLLILLATCAGAQVKVVTGKVTYVVVGTIYTSLGRENGLQDSSLVVVSSKGDTLALLKVYAVSSHSSACRILSSRGTISMGNDVSASIEIVQKQPVAPDSVNRSVRTQTAGNESLSQPATRVRIQKGSNFVSVRGRVSAQFYTTRQDFSELNTAQPGVVVSLRGNVRDLPLKFELYGNFRTLAYGRISPFSKHATNQSRLYRLSLEYDDGVNDVSVGRIIPAIAPSVGYIDGAMLSRQFGGVQIGSAIGFQPGYSLWDMDTEFRKFAVFAGYRWGQQQNSMISSAYSRTYYQNHLDRELATAQVNVFSSGGFFLYANSEIDLRTKSGSELRFRPSLTSLYVNLNYRLTDYLTVGVGGDASRPFYTYSLIQNIPDGLLDFRLRSGVNFNISLALPGGLMLYETFSPRNPDASFGREYSNVATLSVVNIFSSGLNIRTNMNLNSNEYTTAQGYGVNLQKNFWSVVDAGIRYQQYDYTVRQISQAYVNRTLGGDILVSLTSALTLTVSYERLQGGGITSRSLFAEFGVRF